MSDLPPDIVGAIVRHHNALLDAGQYGEVGCMDRVAQARAALDAAILKHLGEAASRPKPETAFICPKCSTKRGWLPACAQDGCPLLGLNGEEVAHVE